MEGDAAGARATLSYDAGRDCSLALLGAGLTCKRALDGAAEAGDAAAATKEWNESSGICCATGLVSVVVTVLCGFSFSMEGQ